MHGTFATSVSCMDGRVQEPISRYLKEKFRIDFIDTITEPGPNKILAENSPVVKIESIRQRIEISLNKHKSNLIAVSGHYDCAGNPTTMENQLGQIRTAIEHLSKWYPSVKIIGLWIDDNWKVQEVNPFL
jgi:carbonic anhydrase